MQKEPERLGGHRRPERKRGGKVPAKRLLLLFVGVALVLAGAGMVVVSGS